jgi:tRNA-splicing ligase RtcB
MKNTHSSTNCLLDNLSRIERYRGWEMAIAVSKDLKKTRVIDLSMTEDGAAKKDAKRVAALPYVTDVMMLPDLHIKGGMEAPSSLVVATQGVIVPHLASSAINDGMGLITTDIDVDGVSTEQLLELLRLINREAAKTKFSTTKYSWSRQQLYKAMLNGVQGLLADYDLDKSWLEAIENKGKGGVGNITEQDIGDCIPGFLRKSKFTRCEIGLNFGGNHFLEIQVVDKVIESKYAERWGLKQGKLGIMYHLGPGPLGGNVLNLYASRAKPSFHRKVGYAVFRCLYQAMKGWERWKTFGGFNPWLVLDVDSKLGRTFETVTGVVDNYGYAYRMGTLRAILDALEKVFCAASKDIGVRLVTDISHNSLQAETYNGQRLWVSRHNCCRPKEGLPGIVAGSNRASSCITYGLKGCEDSVYGYDHGIGMVLEKAEAKGTVQQDSRKLHSMRVTMLPGTDKIVKKEKFTIYDTSVSDKVIDKLAGAGVISKVAYMRPLMTLKMIR